MFFVLLSALRKVDKIRKWKKTVLIGIRCSQNLKISHFVLGPYQ